MLTREEIADTLNEIGYLNTEGWEFRQIFDTNVFQGIHPARGTRVVDELTATAVATFHIQSQRDAQLHSLMHNLRNDFDTDMICFRLDGLLAEYDRLWAENNCDE